MFEEDALILSIAITSILSVIAVIIFHPIARRNTYLKLWNLAYWIYVPGCTITWINYSLRTTGALLLLSVPFFIMSSLFFGIASWKNYRQIVPKGHLFWYLFAIGIIITLMFGTIDGQAAFQFLVSYYIIISIYPIYIVYKVRPDTHILVPLISQFYSRV